VLLVDLDPQAYATSYFGLYDDERVGVYQVMAEDFPAEAAVVPTGYDRLALLPTTHQLEAVETYLSTIAYDQEYILRDALLPVAEDYDFILLDCPPAGVRIKTNALAAADGLVLPTIPDSTATKGMTRLSKQLAGITRRVNPGLRVLGVLMTRVERTNAHEVARGLLQENKTFPCFRTVIRKNTALEAAQLAMKPVIHYERGSNGAKDYTAFTDELLEVM
jgi:chromosome partitioning protein